MNADFEISVCNGNNVTNRSSHNAHLVNGNVTEQENLLKKIKENFTHEKNSITPTIFSLKCSSTENLSCLSKLLLLSTVFCLCYIFLKILILM